MQCKNCGKSFTLDGTDGKFFEKMRVPAPGKCTDCIMQNLYAFRNERSFYKINCRLCGKGMISAVSPDRPHKVFCSDCWWSDKWSPLDTGREIDFTRPFFEQFGEMFERTPIVGLIVGNCENSDYTNFSLSNKNCYMVSASDYNEDCFYSTYIFKSRDAVDCIFSNECECVYGLVDCKNCYGSAFLQNCGNCSDCMFCCGCKSCHDCIGCVNLINKSYHIFNKPYAREEYLKLKNSFEMTDENLRKFTAQFEEFKKQFPVKYAEIEACVNSSGDHLTRCKNCLDCYDLVECQDLKHATLSLKAKDAMYAVGVPNSELAYQSAASPENYNIKFSGLVWPKSTNLQYCLFPRMSNNCFGCVSVHRKEYCILNKQYSKSEYENLVKKLERHMLSTGEYGNFFPMSLSPFYYNETAAQYFYPLNESQVKALGGHWADTAVKTKTHTDYKIPAKINDVTDDILTVALQCGSCGRNYKIISQELNFYRKMELPIPLNCWDCRITSFAKLRNPRKIIRRNCEKCGQSMLSTVPVNRSAKVYCEKCYLEEVY